jgi:hypothetical protein
MAILASYTVPGLGDYVQYAIMTFSLEKGTTIQVKYTASIPYSAIPSTFKWSPQLMTTSTLAFIVFDQTIIAVSINRKSVFEESVVLNDNEILYTDIRETDNSNVATIYTLIDGILEFEIDTEKICASGEAGNIYAGIVDDVVSASLNKFKLYA